MVVSGIFTDQNNLYDGYMGTSTIPVYVQCAVNTLLITVRLSANLELYLVAYNF